MLGGPQAPRNKEGGGGGVHANVPPPYSEVISHQRTAAKQKLCPQKNSKGLFNLVLQTAYS